SGLRVARLSYPSGPRPRTFVTTMPPPLPERSMSLATSSAPSLLRQSTVTERLPWFRPAQYIDLPVGEIGHLSRSGPPPGGSILTTSAPSSPSVSPARGPATNDASSTTVTPASGIAGGFVLSSDRPSGRGSCIGELSPTINVRPNYTSVRPY